MKNILLAFVVLLTPLGARAIEVMTPSGIVDVKIPPEFTSLSASEIEAKFGRTSRLPLAAYGNKDRSASVAVTWSEFKESPLTQDKLPKLKAFLEEFMTQNMKGISWISSELKVVTGHTWIRMENTLPGTDGSVIHNVIFSSDLNGNMVGVNFNVTEGQFPQYKQYLIQSVPALKSLPTTGSH